MSREHNTGNSESHPDVLFWLAEIAMSHGQTVLRFFSQVSFFSLLLSSVALNFNTQKTANSLCGRPRVAGNQFASLSPQRNR